jgi:hypothetical protein
VFTHKLGQRQTSVVLAARVVEVRIHGAPHALNPQWVTVGPLELDPPGALRHILRAGQMGVNPQQAAGRIRPRAPLIRFVHLDLHFSRLMRGGALRLAA